MQTGRADQMRGFEISGFSVEDAEHLRRSAEPLGPVVHAVLDALYDYLLSTGDSGLIRNRGYLAPQAVARLLDNSHDRRSS